MRFKGKGIVWDGENDRPLVEFVGAAHGKDGEYETNDKRTIEALKKLGYEAISENENDIPFDESPVSEEMSAKELREIAKQRNITIPFGATKDVMVQTING